MRILIGTPIHIKKDYCMQRWLTNVSQIRSIYPADLLMVDNTVGIEYIKKVHTYCKKIGITNYKLDHFEAENAKLFPDLARSINVEIAQELLRQATLKGDYDAWFSWECDQIIPPDTLQKLVQIMKKEACSMLVINSWSRKNPGQVNANMGVTLISKEALQKGWFLPFEEGKVSYDLKNFYNVDETLFKKRLLQNGGNYIELYGVINPIYHLDQ